MEAAVSRIGVTGHMDLPPSAVVLIDSAIRLALAPHAVSGLTGISCIAPGADTIFARAVLDLGGDLEVVIPSQDYRAHLAESEDVATFDTLVEYASKMHIMPAMTAGPEAYADANEAVLGLCDVLFAVWDGKVAVDEGGTAAVVQHARARHLPIEIIWPAGAARA